MVRRTQLLLSLSAVLAVAAAAEEPECELVDFLHKQPVEVICDGITEAYTRTTYVMSRETEAEV